MTVKKEQKRTTLKKAAMLDAMRKNLGNVTQSLKTAAVARTAYYKWLKEDEKFAADIEQVTDYTFDFVESKIMKAIQDGNITMTIFFAKTRMKSRGYVERQEISVDNKPAFIVRENKEAVNRVLDVIHKHNEGKRTG